MRCMGAAAVCEKNVNNPDRRPPSAGCFGWDVIEPHLLNRIYGAEVVKVKPARGRVGPTRDCRAVLP